MKMTAQDLIVYRSEWKDEAQARECLGRLLCAPKKKNRKEKVKKAKTGRSGTSPCHDIMSRVG